MRFTHRTPGRLLPILALHCLWLAPAAISAQAPPLPQELPPPLTELQAPEPIPWINVDGYLPERPSDAEAPALYAEAADRMREMPGYPRLPTSIEAFREPGPLREALRVAFEGAACSNADFLGAYSYRAWEDDALPDLPAALVIGRALGRGARLYLDSGDIETAGKVARAAISMGEHFRSGAPMLAQALVGERIVEEGMLALRLCARRRGDDESAIEIARRIGEARGADEMAELKSATSRALLWDDPLRALDSLDEPDPVIRADALLFLEACFHPEGSRRLLGLEDMAPLVQEIRAHPGDIRPRVQRLRSDTQAIVRRLAERADRAIASP